MSGRLQRRGGPYEHGLNPTYNGAPRRVVNYRVMRSTVLKVMVAAVIAATSMQTAVVQAAQVDDAQSTSGPIPPPGLFDGYKVDTLAPLAGDTPQNIVAGVPPYHWHDGCGPTAAGMVIGYWDGHGFPDLVPGSAFEQTAAVDAMMASPEHYDEYALPMDWPGGPLEPDLSEPPAGDEHSDDSVADFMRTSQSASNNYYGWSWYSHMDDGLVGYAQYANSGYDVTCQSKTWGTFTWGEFCAEIDAHRPVVFLVDFSADGVSDHFITAIGYREDERGRMYASYNTWDPWVHWYDFGPMSTERRWGIYGATFFRIAGTLTPSSVTVTWPDACDIELTAGSIVTILWDYEGTPGSVDIHLEKPTRRGTRRLGTIVTETPCDGEYGWLISEKWARGRKCRITVTTVDGGASDTSDCDFRIRRR